MIKLADPEIGQEELEEIKAVLASKWLAHGEWVEAFESLISKYLEVSHVIALSSGTAALHLALHALDIGPKDEVIVPDFTFPASANVVELVGAKTVLCDICEDTFCIDTSKIEKLITGKTRAIMPVHEFGHVADMDQIIELSKKYHLSIIEDAACALGAEYKGVKAGTLGDVGCFSFHPRKVITTGEGGVVVTNNTKLAIKLRLLRDHGMLNTEAGKVLVMPGYNYRMTNIQGAIGKAQIPKLQNIISKRRLLAEKYFQMLSDLEEVKIPICKEYCKHVYQTYHILLSNGINRDKVMKALKMKGIETNIGAYAVHLQQYYLEKYSYNYSAFGNSINAYKQGLALPMHTYLSVEDIEYVVSNLIEVMRE
ncbi:MAG: glutamine--scyllo-inositol aminotransferase [Firmicutes bacterium HGW-Firmicutes-1]|nr:MAG: glutamine--scyllo-inositol aminotransferase [Firmicutes bacterium HGW-Firmicutes-1]